MNAPHLPHQRELCVRCRRSSQTCFCRGIQSFNTGFDLVLLQHPNERRSSVTTARMTHLFVQGSHLIEGIGFEDHPAVQAWLENRTLHCAVLYPGPQSSDIRESTWSIPPGKKLLVFVLDGTWSTAAKMLRLSPTLARLPKISVSSARTSEYHFKRQPRRECLSTLEAVDELIGVLEPQTKTSGMLEHFRSLVQLQLKSVPHQSFDVKLATTDGLSR